MRGLRPGKAGFTLMEALVVLAITSLTASLIFTIGARGGQTVLRLGNRALDVADGQLARDTFRSVVGDLIVPPLVTQAQAEGGVEDTADTSLTGDASTLSSQWLGQRASACGSVGDTGRMVLALSQNSSGHAILSCQLDDAEPITLLDLGTRNVRFQYSEDGATWTEAWSVEAGQGVTDSADPTNQDRKVYVRLGAEDGRGELVALTRSGRTLVQGIPF